MSDLSVFNDPTLEAGFARDGMVIVPLLAADEIAHLRAVYDRYPGEHATPFSASILSLDLDYRRFVFDQVSSTVAARASALFRSYRVFSAGFLSKQPDPDGAMPVHQDLTLVAEGPRAAITIWCPLVDVDPENGCVSVVRGSHDTNQQPRAAGTPFAYPEIESLLRAVYLEALPMRAGEGLVLHHSIFHCSPPNLSTRERPVAVTVFAPMERSLVYYHREAGPPATLEQYAVDDEFYLRHALGTRPTGAPLIGVVPEAVDPLPPDRFLATQAV